MSGEAWNARVVGADGRDLLVIYRVPEAVAVAAVIGVLAGPPTPGIGYSTPQDWPRVFIWREAW